MLNKSMLANILVFFLILSVAISPKCTSDNTARIFTTSAAGILIYLNTDAYCLTNTLLVYCGDISYVLYLVHWPIIVAARYYIDSQVLSSKGIAIVLFSSFALAVLIHHTFEKLFMKGRARQAFLWVIACYACIFGARSMFPYSPQLERINQTTSKVEYAIEWNLKASQISLENISMSCSEDDTSVYTKFQGGPKFQCLAEGNGTGNIILVGNSIAYVAYPLIHSILKGRYRKFRLYAQGGCPPLSNWCPDFSEAMRKVVEHEKPDILLNMHYCTFDPFVVPFNNIEEDQVYKEFQGNINFISKYTKYIVIDMPYYGPEFAVGKALARRLQRGLPLGDEFVVTWQQYLDQTQYHRKRLSLLNCSKCIMNEINEALFKDGLFYLYDPDTLLARIGDGVHMTPVGLKMLQPLYTRIIEKLLRMLT